MLRDRGLLVPRGQTWELAEGAEIPFPEGIHGIISARLDTLTPDRKGLLQDASVIGKDFWSGALEAMGDRDGPGSARRSRAHEERVPPRAPDVVDGGRERVHVLAHARAGRGVRPDPSGRQSRQARRRGALARGAARVSGWKTSRTCSRTTPSRRWSSHALRVGMCRAWSSEALRFLVLAGDRANNLDAAQAVVMYERALELAPEGDPVRGEILHELALVEWSRGRFGRSRELLEEAIPSLHAAGRPARAADSKVLLALVMATIAPSDADRRLLDEAIAELERLPPGKELVDAYAMRAGWDAATGPSSSWADKSLSLAEELGLPSPPVGEDQPGRARVAGTVTWVGSRTSIVASTSPSNKDRSSSPLWGATISRCR